TALSLRTSGAVNGVSKLHGDVTKEMWQPIWPETPREQLPLHFITNGVHVPTWMSAEMGTLLERHLGPDWLDRHDDPAVADRVLSIPHQEPWGGGQPRSRLLFGLLPRTCALP